MKKKHLQLVIGLVVSAFFIWFAFRAGHLEMERIWGDLKRFEWMYAFPFMVVTMISFFWRSIRFEVLARPIGKYSPPRLFGPIMIGFAFNNILPARAGEFARPLALMKQDKIPFAAGMSLTVAERLVDVLTLLVLLILMPYYVTLDPSIRMSFKMGDSELVLSAAWLESNMPKLSVAALVIMAGVLTFLVPAIRDLYIRILHALPLVPGGLKKKVEGIVLSFSRGFESLKSPMAILLIIIHSAVIWLSVGFSFQLLSWGMPGTELSYGQALTFLVFTCLVISIPSSPGFFGVYEFGGMVALVLMNVVTNDHAGNNTGYTFTFLAHLLQWIPTTAWGLWAAARLSISASDAEAVAAGTKEEPAQA